MVHLCRTLAIAAAACIGSCDAFANQQQKQSLHGQLYTQQKKKAQYQEDNDFASSSPSIASNSRRAWIAGGLAVLLTSPSPANAVRAIGGAEEDCRAAGNCLEIGELDGAIGWTWGGKDRCEATDPRCGANGQLMDSVPSGAAVPDTMGLKITDIVTLEFSIGTRSDAEKLTIKLGLYGENSQASVKQFLDFITSGLRTTSDLIFENGMGVESAPVALSRGGIVAQIEPQKRLDIGIPSQAAAYARSKGKNKIDDFLAQPRPKAILDEEALRPRNAAGLVTIPGKGVGYGGTTLESDDEAYESSFQITAAPFEGKDRDPSQQRVIGQLIDQESMANLARLASLPTKKGFKGVIPGQNSGPPLLKVTLTGIEVQPVAGSNS
ncbi:unnamed protein product [Cylindrotheca closterium]|uniref:Peptidylprolyl isomerase n=1 Tax=Cylindrotheca closterium TaxID=2856 RepID=A0AAD2FN87_9STRA|nr:unnamed protein product [Cylindrotheca closterium]